MGGRIAMGQQMGVHNILSQSVFLSAILKWYRSYRLTTNLSHFFLLLEHHDNATPGAAVSSFKMRGELLYSYHEVGIEQIKSTIRFKKQQ
jgi:hypothetical protein